MKKLGKINLRTIERDLSESEMKFVTGGSNYGYEYNNGGGIPCNRGGLCRNYGVSLP